MNLDEVNNMETRRCPECGQPMPEDPENDLCPGCSAESDCYGVYLILR